MNKEALRTPSEQTLSQQVHSKLICFWIIVFVIFGFCSCCLAVILVCKIECESKQKSAGMEEVLERSKYLVEEAGICNHIDYIYVKKNDDGTYMIYGDGFFVDNSEDVNEYNPYDVSYVYRPFEMEISNEKEVESFDKLYENMN